MSDAINRAKSWEIASVRTTKSGKTFLAFNQDVKILVGDREVDLGEYRSIFLDDAVENLNFLLENEKIDQTEYDKRLNTLTEKNIKGVVRAKLS